MIQCVLISPNRLAGFSLAAARLSAGCVYLGDQLRTKVGLPEDTRPGAHLLGGRRGMRPALRQSADYVPQGRYVYVKVEYLVKRKLSSYFPSNCTIYTFNSIDERIPYVASRQEKIRASRMGNPDQVAGLHVAGNPETQEVLHPRPAEGIRDQQRTEKCGQTTRITTRRDPLHSETRKYIYQ